MSYVLYRNRRVVDIENEDILVSITLEGGHIARLLDKRTGVNPLWAPHWSSIEPSQFTFEKHPEFGTSNEAKLVAGLLGHSICLDLFGAPSDSEAAAGMPVHGEAPIAQYEVESTRSGAVLHTELPLAGLTFERQLTLHPEGVVHFRETVKNTSATDRPIGWTQHVTLGSPFLQPGLTQFLVTCDRSQVIDASFNQGLGNQLPGKIFDWPMCPMRDGSIEDLRVQTAAPASAGFTAHRMNSDASCASFAAWSPTHRLVVGYAWKPNDFPWLSRWEENHLRPWKPWNRQGYALGMEFGVSPFVKDRRSMVELGPLFNTPTCLWLGAREQRTVEYVAFLRHASSLPATVEWDGEAKVHNLSAHRQQLHVRQGALQHG